MDKDFKKFLIRFSFCSPKFSAVLAIIFYNKRLNMILILNKGRFVKTYLNQNNDRNISGFERTLEDLGIDESEWEESETIWLKIKDFSIHNKPKV